MNASKFRILQSSEPLKVQNLVAIALLKKAPSRFARGFSKHRYF
jgi:hypothetical protein